MPWTEPLTADDLDAISHGSFSADDPLAIAAFLVGAADRGQLAEKSDTSYALLMAAEITRRSGTPEAALVLADRAVEAYRLHGGVDDVYPRTFRAELLFQLGRDDEAMAELRPLRPLLSSDALAADGITEALGVGGRTELAEQWLSTALVANLAAYEEMFDEDDRRQSGAATLGLARIRYRVRRELGLPEDKHDELADRMRQALDGHRDPGHAGTAALFWPRQEFERVVVRWPALAATYGHTWDEHRTELERDLVRASDDGETLLDLLAGTADDLAAYAARHDGEVTDPEIRDGYLDRLDETRLPTHWPPGRNEPCWCGSGHKYKKCCLPRSRA